MDILIKSGKLSGNLQAITSKSSMHRLLISAALADTETEILFSDTNEDIEATISVLGALGAKFTRNTDGIIVSPISNIADMPMLYCNQSASTARFIIPIAAATANNATISGDEQLAKRPLTPLLNEMRNHDVEIHGDTLPITISSKLKSGRYSLPGNISSQYISGLLFALPLVEGDSEIFLTTELESAPYVKMTIDSISRFGISIEKTKTGFKMKGGQKYTSPKNLQADTDWSNSAFWLVAAASGNDLTIKNLDLKSLQGDKKIIELLDGFGAGSSVSVDGISFTSDISKAQTINAKDVPDLVPILAVAASNATGKTVIQNIERLKIKESDRVSSVIGMINALGGNASLVDNAIVVNGTSGLLGGVVDSGGDHRIAMAAAVAACISSGEVLIQNAEAVNKSYPNFFEHYKYLGGEIYVQ